MFSNGKFKNVVALVNSKEECPLLPYTSVTRTYTLQPAKGATKNWIALEDSFSKSGAALASTVTCPSNNPEDRNVFAIYVSYYVKVKILVSAMGGELSLKLPFTLIHSANELPEIMQLESRPSQDREIEKPSDKIEVIKEEPVKVECHEPKPMKNINNISNILPKKCKSKKSAIQDENEIIKCEEEGAI